jgi:Flp pilus assembly protein TadD
VLAAIASQREAVRLNERDSNAHNALAAALAKTGDIESAKKHLALALQIEPVTAKYAANLRCLEQAQRACEVIP